MFLLFFNIYLLAVLGLSCSMQDLSLWREGPVVVARGLSCPRHVGSYPDQGSNHVPPHSGSAESLPLDRQGSPCSFLL